LNADLKSTAKLKVATAVKRLVATLETIGFKSIKARTPTMVMNLNDETEVTLYPGVQRHAGSVLIDPVIVLYNTKLNARLLRSGWKDSSRVCHFYLSMMCSWNRLYVNDEAELDEAVHLVAGSVVDVGLPIISEYDSFDKVRKLFEDDIAHKKRVPVAVLFAKEKLERMREH